MSEIAVFDTTLRDGEQSPGASMTPSEKLRMAHEIDGLGVQVIEAGFAACSGDDFSGIRRVAEEIRRPTVACLARAHLRDIELAAKALDKAAHPRIHVFIATSDIHLEGKLRITREECLERAVMAVEAARGWVDDVEFSAEDATRTDHAFLCQVVDAAVRAGATVLNIPDTVGYAVPQEMSELIEMLLANVPDLRYRTISVHCHDDLGLAVANTLAAVAGGATQVECTVNGIGERAGNAALEEIVMALRVRHDVLGHTTSINAKGLTRTSQLLAHITGIHPPRNKAIVGRNAFAHEAGIHQHGMLRNPLTYEIMTPAMVGAARSEMVLGKHSGRAALADRYEQLGFHLSVEELADAYQTFVALAEQKKEVLDEDLISIVHHGAMEDLPRAVELVSLEVTCGGTTSHATAEIAGEELGNRIGRGEGDGPIAAAFSAIDAVVENRVVLEDLRIRASTHGRDAVGEVSIRARIDGRTFTGRGASTDVVAAAAAAYVHALNKAHQAMVLEGRALEQANDMWGV